MRTLLLLLCLAVTANAQFALRDSRRKVGYGFNDSAVEYGAPLTHSLVDQSFVKRTNNAIASVTSGVYSGVNCAVFSGNAAYIRAQYTRLYQEPMSFSMWFHTAQNAVSTFGRSFFVVNCDGGGSGTDFYFEANRTTAPNLQMLRGIDIKWPTGYANFTNRWIHYAATISGQSNSWTTIQYIDGVQAASNTAAVSYGFLGKANTSISLGAAPWGGAPSMPGGYSEVTFWGNTTLTAAQVKQLYESGRIRHPL